MDVGKALEEEMKDPRSGIVHNQRVLLGQVLVPSLWHVREHFPDALFISINKKPILPSQLLLTSIQSL